MIISLLAPKNNGADISVYDVPDKTKSIEYKFFEFDNEAVCTSIITSDVCNTVSVSCLNNGKKYKVIANALDESGKLTETSAARILIPNYVPGKCISYLHPYDSAFDPAGRFIGSPSILKLENGDLIASHDIFLDSFPNRFGVDFQQNNCYERCVTKVYKSENNGETWNYISDIHCCTFGKLFSFHGNTYIIGLSANSDTILHDPFNVDERKNQFGLQKGLDVKIFCSRDGGYTWSEPCSITKGVNVGFHKAATPVIECDGRLWVAFDSPKDIKTGFGLGIASVDVNEDIMQDSNWVVSDEFLHYNPNWEGTINGIWPYMMEEANAVSLNNDVYIIARYNSVNYSAEFINPEDDGLKVIIAKVSTKEPSKQPEFIRMNHFIGSLSKFTINYDEKSKKYYSLVSRATGNMCCQRNILSLVSSDDLIDWKIERDCINLADMGWYQNCRQAGMYYCDWVFDGDDILAVCRTSLHDSINYHDSNMMTFHVFKNFRECNYNRKSQK